HLRVRDCGSRPTVRPHQPCAGETQLGPSLQRRRRIERVDAGADDPKDPAVLTGHVARSNCCRRKADPAKNENAPHVTNRYSVVGGKGRPPALDSFPCSGVGTRGGARGASPGAPPPGAISVSP